MGKQIWIGIVILWTALSASAGTVGITYDVQTRTTHLDFSDPARMTGDADAGVGQAVQVYVTGRRASSFLFESSTVVRFLELPQYGLVIQIDRDDIGGVPVGDIGGEARLFFGVIQGTCQSVEPHLCSQWDGTADSAQFSNPNGVSPLSKISWNDGVDNFTFQVVSNPVAAAPEPALLC